MWKFFSVFVLSQPFLISLMFLNLSLRRICVLCRFLGVWFVFTRVSLTTCQFALYENCTVVVYRVICRCFTVLCLYVSTCLSCLSCVWISAPWLEVHFSNWRSNLNLCINSFLGFERLCYGCEIREICLFVFSVVCPCNKYLLYLCFYRYLSPLNWSSTNGYINICVYVCLLVCLVFHV